ncbi:hypothetical protein C2S52_020607 [Perilla frutescens var. hirtella]|nr:hypothetical protein C2S52_020607 [Perilla frutescens var. hirtella]
MELVVNFIKLSSTSLAALIMWENRDHTNRAAVADRFSNYSNSNFIKSRRSQAEASEPKTKTYVIEHDAGLTGYSSAIIISEDHAADNVFSDYIYRFHRRNQDELNREASNGKVSSHITKNSNNHTLATSAAGFPRLKK